MKSESTAATPSQHLPLCDLGFGPFACFVTLKPCKAAHISTNSSDSLEIENSDEARGNGGNAQQLLIVQDDHQKGANSLDASNSTKHKRHLYQLSDNDSPSLQSFSSGGSSPSSARPRRRQGQGVPARHLTGDTGKGLLKDASKTSIHHSGHSGHSAHSAHNINREHSSWKHEGAKTHPPHLHVTGNDEADQQLLLDAWHSCRLMEATLLEQ